MGLPCRHANEAWPPSVAQVLAAAGIPAGLLFVPKADDATQALQLLGAVWRMDSLLVGGTPL